jgi:predicted permease
MKDFLPCLIFHRFATQFDPQTLPGWWKLALMGTALQIVAVGLGRLVARRHQNQETTLLIGYQNAGYFVLPMLQAVLPASQFDRAALMLFVFIIFFNSSLWPVANWALLGKREFDWRAVIFSPPTFVTLIALVVFGLFHDFAHRFDASIPSRIFLGGAGSPGALQMVGDLTVPLATLVLGGAIARTLAGGLSNVAGKRASLEIAWWKLVFLPLCGFLILHFWRVDDPALRVLIILEFAAPPAVNIAVFCQQFGYPMKLIPTASLLCYAACIVTVPLWVALVM